MVLSMTGFGRGVVDHPLLTLTIEIKTVNHRYTDFHFKMPKKFNAFEEQLKKTIKSQISRGRIEVYVQSEGQTTGDFVVKPNLKVVDAYTKALREIVNHVGIEDRLTLSHLTRYQEVLEITSEDLEEEAVGALLQEGFKEALDHLMQMRMDEGQRMAEDISNLLVEMETVLFKIEERAPEIVATHHAKMKERISELLQDVAIDENRLAMEIALFADKTNIAEEIVRLRSHFIQVRQFLAEDGPAGRKLDFLIQEMNREVNTIGSKSPDIDISNDVVALKSALEKMREQVQNIE